MADVFISYSREDREWVEGLATQLQSAGYTVWWDWDLLVGKRYRETIDNELKTCKATIVVWSQHSIQSDFVRDEAEEAQQRNVLVPVLKESVRPPAGFRQIQTADLSTWTGAGDHAEFRRVLRAVDSFVGSPVNADADGHTPPVQQNSPASAMSTPLMSVPPTQVRRSQNLQAILPQIAAQLPPLSPRTWRFIGFGAAGLLFAVLIASQFGVSGRKPIIPSVATNAAMPQSVNPDDEPDMGQTGPRRAATGGGHADNDNSDSGDIGQGGAR